jgi:pimeloyl-ACP methyl ester carboxylesterase
MDAPQVQYVKTSDGHHIAFTVSGEGLPFIFMPAASSHVQLNWSPASRFAEWLPGLTERFRLVCYDGRGQGMSDRGLGSDYSMTSLLIDLEAIVNRLQLERFVLMGSHASGHAAIGYSASHPSRVRGLVLTPTSTVGKDWSVIANVELAKQNWEFFLSFFNQSIPTLEGRAENVEILRKSVTQDDWLQMAPVWQDSDVGTLLPKVLAPTLILHPRQYLNIPVTKSAQVAAVIPNARLTLIDGLSSVGDAASGLKAIDGFFAELASQSAVVNAPHSANLSERELEVLRLLSHSRQVALEASSQQARPTSRSPTRS